MELYLHFPIRLHGTILEFTSHCSGLMFDFRTARLLDQDLPHRHDLERRALELNFRSFLVYVTDFCKTFFCPEV